MSLKEWQEKQRIAKVERLGAEELKAKAAEVLEEKKQNGEAKIKCIRCSTEFLLSEAVSERNFFMVDKACPNCFYPVEMKIVQE